MRRRTLRGYTLAVEAATFAAALAALLAALFAASVRVDAVYAARRSEEALKATVLVDSVIERGRGLVRRLGAEPGLLSAVALVDDFSDLYLVGEDGRVSAILAKSPGSGVFEGFDMGYGAPGELLSRTVERYIAGSGSSGFGVAVSGVARGVEDERPSVYLATRLASGWLLGRIRVEAILGELRRIADYSGTVILLASADGRILASTRPGLGLDLLPARLDLPFEAFGEGWLASEALHEALGDRIVVLSPARERAAPLALLWSLGPAAALAFLAAAAARSFALSRRALAPLARFAETLEVWDLEPGPPPVEERLLAFEEIASLSRSFRKKREEIGRALEETRRRDERILALNSELEDRVRERTASLEAANERLSGANRELRATQDRLVDAEKLAALGRLAAETAHELNTPLGAIRSSAVHVAEVLEQELARLPGFAAGLSDRDLGLYRGLVGRALSAADPARHEDRRRSLALVRGLLEEKAVADADLLADDLADMGFGEGDEAALSALLESPRAAELVESAYALSGALRASRLILLSADKAAWTVDALRSFGYGTAADEAQRVDPIAGIETVLALMHGKLKRGVEVLRRYDRDVRVKGRPKQLDQVWINLIGNAWDAMQGKGRLEISVLREGGEVVVEFADSGSGIPDAVKDRIFTPFFTTKEEGSGLGLGLDICRRIVESHGGSIGFESRPGRTVFRVRLPSYDASGQDAG